MKKVKHSEILMKPHPTAQKQNSQVPVIYWQSDPVMPDETVVLAGADFDAGCVVELSVVDGATDIEQGWTAVAPLQWSELSLKAVVPAGWAKGVYACRVRKGGSISKTVFLNAPDVWWKQGEGGVDSAISGSWLRVFGKCLDVDGGARVRLVGGPELELEERGGFALRAKLPSNLPAATYQVEVSNGSGGEDGWRSAGALAVAAAVPDTRPVFNVVDYGADPTGMKDCSMAFDAAIVYSHGQGGGIIFVPRGRYRIDGIMRPGIFMADSPLVLPENVSLRGEGAGLTSLWWPTREKPLSSLIECRSHSSVEDLAIYSQGPMNLVIIGDSQVTLKNLVIRANPYYMTTGPGGSHHGNRTPDKPGAQAISLVGENNRILGCDILCSSTVLDIRGGRGTVVSGNTIRGNGTHALNYCSEMIYENNHFEGSLMAGGGNIAL
ncbi:MAG: glycosyl hydrolase family 28-related protein, partial [Terrimicrobiaceae bacterium]